MNLKKKLGAFFTLTRKGNGGFTLVELIVVIAILAILGGVAVPAYSGYVEKANKQADISLISDIEHALTLAGYAGTFAEGEGGYITLSAETPFTSAEAVAGSDLDKALEAAFGSGYSLQLSYGEWGSSGLLDELNPYYADKVVNSNYMTGVRQNSLLTDVEKMTSMVTDLLPAMSGGETNFTKLFTIGEKCAIDETAKRYGIEKDPDETWEEWGEQTGNATAYSNLLVLTAADEYDKFLEAEMDLGVISEASTYILQFSNYYGLASKDPEFSGVMDTYMDDLADVRTPQDGMTWWNNLKNSADEDNKYGNYSGQDGDNDMKAFASIMAALGNPTKEQAAKVGSDLNNATLFSDGVVNGMYNDFMDAATAMAGMYVGGDEDHAPIPLGDGEIAVLFTQSNGGVTVMNSMPTA